MAKPAKKQPITPAAVKTAIPTNQSSGDNSSMSRDVTKVGALGVLWSVLVNYFGPPLAADIGIRLDALRDRIMASEPPTIWEPMRFYAYYFFTQEYAAKTAYDNSDFVFKCLWYVPIVLLAAVYATKNLYINLRNKYKASSTHSDASSSESPPPKKKPGHKHHRRETPSSISPSSTSISPGTTDSSVDCKEVQAVVKGKVKDVIICDEEKKKERKPKAHVHKNPIPAIQEVVVSNPTEPIVSLTEDPQANALAQRLLFMAEKEKNADEKFEGRARVQRVIKERLAGEKVTTGYEQAVKVDVDSKGNVNEEHTRQSFAGRVWRAVSGGR